MAITKNCAENKSPLLVHTCHVLVTYEQKLNGGEGRMARHLRVFRFGDSGVKANELAHVKAISDMR